jgi:predicted RNA binding protein YcfA (HicA-like mRNA interferase family)
MAQWGAQKASAVLKALFRIGWVQKRQNGSHRVLTRLGWADYTFAFHESEEIGPKMLAKVAKHTGLIPEDL